MGANTTWSKALAVAKFDTYITWFARRLMLEHQGRQIGPGPASRDKGGKAAFVRITSHVTTATKMSDFKEPALRGGDGRALVRYL